MEKGTMIKDFRKRVLEKKSQVNDKEFFLSEHCHAYLQNLAEAICKAYDSSIHVIMQWTDSKYVAFATSRNEMTLNINNELFHKADGRIDKLVLLKGMVLHECGHLLFTDYHLLKSAMKVFTENRKMFPEPKCPEYTELLTDMALFNDEDLKEWTKIYKRLENTVEDGFIESMVLKTVPGEGQCLFPLREMQLKEFESVKVMKTKLSNPAILFNCILMLAKYNTVKMDADDADEPAVKALLNCYDLIREAVQTQKSYKRVQMINELFCKLYKFMKEDQKEQNDSGSSSEENEENESESQSQSPNSSANTTGTDNNDSESDNAETSEQNSSDNNKSTEQGTGENNSSDTNSGKQNCKADDNANNGTGENELPSPSGLLDNAADMMEENIDTGCGSVLNDSNINQDNYSPASSNQKKIENMTKEEKPEASIPSPSDKRMADTIEESIASQSVYEEAEKELAEELKQEAQDMDYTPINKSEKIDVVRGNPTDRSKQIYKNDMESINFLVKKTIDEIRNKIKDHQQGGKINGLYQGRYLDRNSLYRYDLRMLCKNDLPEDIPNMAFSVLIDASGSMNSDNKLISARQTALLIYHFGIALNIPVMVYSHRVTGNVQLNALADYGSVDGNDKYRICDLQAHGCNRDGMALRFCSERLSKRPEETKICFVISDGLPSDYNSSKEAETDIRNVLMDYSKKNVKYIAFGLGNCQKDIEHLYTQDLSPKIAAKFIKTDEPELLPKKMVQSIKELIKV